MEREIYSEIERGAGAGGDKGGAGLPLVPRYLTPRELCSYMLWLLPKLMAVIEHGLFKPHSPPPSSYAVCGAGRYAGTWRLEAHLYSSPPRRLRRQISSLRLPPCFKIIETETSPLLIVGV